MACIVETQNEKQSKQEEPDCPSCKRFYKNKLFNDFCFKCFMINYPDKFKLVVKANKIYENHYTEDELNDIVCMNTISPNNGLWRGIRLILKNTYNFGNSKIALEEVACVLRKIARKNEGLTAEQAGFLWQKFKPADNFKYNTEWRIQHLFAGCVVDYWNLKPKINGSVGFCYYHSSKPYKNQKLKLPSLLLELRKNNNDKLTREEDQRLEFWKKSLPF